MARFGVPLEPRKTLLVAHVHALEAGLKERLAQRNLSGSIRLAMVEPAPSGTALLTRTHPLTATLAEALVGKSVGLGTVLAFMMAVTALSLPSLILLKRVVKLPLLATFTGVVAVGILTIGFTFNAITNWFI